MFLTHGFQDFISKPIDIMKLDSVLRKWVRNKNLEKELTGEEERQYERSDGGVLAAGIAINGLDQLRALERFSGDETVFIDVLRSYAASTRLILNNLTNYLTEENFEDYTIAVHGVKGSSYAIFAQEVGKMAEILEYAAKAGDFEAVKTGHFAFSTAAETLLNELDKALTKVDAFKDKPAAIANRDEALNFTAPEAQVLLVDDNEVNLKVALGFLNPLKVRSDTAANGKEALEMIQQKEYHLIFMDHMMPVMDGIEAAEKLRRLKGDYYQNIPIIAFTANDADDAREIFLKAGMNDFVTKPVDRQELCAKVKRWLPEELVLEQADKETFETTPTSQENDDLPVIEGIDAKAGILYSGSKELFLSLLGDFYKLIDLKAAKIEKCLADGLVRDVTIETHALKSTARMIGAQKLSEEFARLEKYGNEENLEALNREIPDILEHYRSYKIVLKSFGQAAEEEKKAASAPELIELLKTIAAAMDNFDLDGADAALKKLEELQLPVECREHMETLRAYVADVAMEEVMKLAAVMIGIIENTPSLAKGYKED
jgi:CheY-like chemotaxis protein